MNIYLIRPVGSVMPAFEGMVVSYRQLLESEGHRVYDLVRDANLDVSELEICRQALAALKEADEVHVLWANRSNDILFSVGMAFALGKPIRPLSPILGTAYKSFNNLMRELRGIWDSDQEA